MLLVFRDTRVLLILYRYIVCFVSGLMYILYHDSRLNLKLVLFLIKKLQKICDAFFLLFRISINIMRLRCLRFLEASLVVEPIMLMISELFIH